ncbi:MAG TPA: hypothetical protein VD767_02905 [Thermomicrobiales bacterium]|nr:hypothetical protein [Thermomicrobiales bacterium]
MNSIIRRVIPIVAGTSLTVTLSVSAALAQGTDQAALCSLEPVSVPLWGGTPAAEVAATPASPAEPAEVDEAEIEGAIVDIVACINTGEPQLMFAIYTDRFLAEQYADPAATYLPEFERRLAENAPEPAGQFSLEAVNGIEPLEDGRVRVTVSMSNGGTAFNDTLVLANQDGTWLIDGIESLDPPA